MLKLLERSVATLEQRMVLVAPSGLEVPAIFRNTSIDPTLRTSVVRQIQRIRGSIYLDEGAIRSHQLSFDGRHCTPEDARSWHLLFLNSENRISSSIWFLHHPPTVTPDQLRIRKCPLSTLTEWRERVSAAIESELARARAQRLGCAEVGGWAVTPETRCTSDGLMLVLAVFSLSNALGGTVVLTTATARHSSSRILRRLGGDPLEADGTAIPPYFDPDYDCTMELLRFDTRRPNPKYKGLVERLQDKLSAVPVIATAVAAPALDTYEFPGIAALQPAVAS